MNSHIVEKTMHSIKNIDRLTDIAAIDVYNTTHDTINKYEIMKEHATEEYTNESFYQESVLAGVLIGAGILGVAISAFFIIKKIIDTKAAGDSSVKSSDGGMISEQIDLRDPKSVQKYIEATRTRLKKLDPNTKIKLPEYIDSTALTESEKKIQVVVDKFDAIIDNKDNAEEIKKIIGDLNTEELKSQADQAFPKQEKEVTPDTLIDALGIEAIAGVAQLLNTLKTKIDKVEKSVNKNKSDKNENVAEISDEDINKLKEVSKKLTELVDSLVTSVRQLTKSIDLIIEKLIKSEAEAKKKTEEAKEQTNPADTGATENKTETDKSKPEVQPSAGAGSGADDKGETKKQQTPEEQARLQKNTSALIAIKNALSKYLSADECEKIQSEIFHEVHDEDGTGIKDILMRYHNDIKSNPAKYHVSSVDDAELVMGNIHKMAMTLIDNCKIMYDPKVAEKAEIYITGNNLSEITTFNNADFNQGEPKADESKAEEPKAEEPKTEESKAEEPATEEQPKQISPEDRQIIDEIKDLIKANNSVTDASILLRMMSSHAKATDSQIKSCTAIAREELKNEPQTEVKSENQEDKNKIDDRQIIDEIKGLLKSDPSISDSDLILKTMTNHVGATSDQIKSCIATASKELKAENPPTPTENSEYPDDALINEKPEFKEGLINDLADYMKQYPDQSDDEAFQIRGFNTLKISPEMAKELKTSARELANKGSSQDTPTETEEPKTEESKAEEQPKQISPEYQQINDEMMKDLLKTNPFISDSEESKPENPSEPEKKPEDQVKTEPENPPTPTDQNTNENAQETTPETSTEESETKSEGENSPAAEETKNATEDTNGVPYNVLSAEYLQSLLNMPEQSAIEAIKKIKDEDIERMSIGIPKNIFVQLFENAASALATISPATYLQQLTDMMNNNAAVNKVKALLYQIKQGDRTAFPKLKTTNFKELAELTDGRDVSDYITSILPRVKSAFDSLVNKYKPEMIKGASQIETHVLNIEQNVVTFFNFIKDACKGLVNKDKALNKVDDMESLIGQLLGKLDPNFSYGDAYSQNEFGNNTKNTPDPFARQRRQGTATAPAQFNPSAPADWNDRMEALGKAGIPNKQIPEPKTAPTPLNPAVPQEWNDKMNALKAAGAENISQKTEVPPIAPIDTDADIAKAKEEKAQLDALQQHRQEQLAQLKAERAQREQQVRDAYAQDAQARQNAMNEELAKQSQEDEQKKAQANELTKANEKANEDANVAEAIRQAEEEKKALEQGKNLSVSPQSTESLDNAAKLIAMQDFIKNFKDPAWREAHPGVVSWQELYNSEDYKNEAIMKAEAERMKNEKLAENRAGIQFIKEQNYEAIVPSLNKVLETTPDDKTITRYLDGLKTAYAKILMQYQQNPGNARKIIEDYSKNGAAPYEFYTVPYNELRQTQLIDWQQRLFNEKVELDKDRKRNRKKIKAVDKIIDKLIELDELLKTSVHNVIAAATKNPMRALEAALVMFQESDEEIIAGLTAIENFINKADEVKASEEEADNTPENPAEEPSDEEVSQSILSILKS